MIDITPSRDPAARISTPARDNAEGPDPLIRDVNDLKGPDTNSFLNLIGAGITWSLGRQHHRVFKDLVGDQGLPLRMSGASP